MQSEQLVGYESVDDRQWRALHEEPCIERSSFLIIIGTGQQPDFLVVLHQPRLHGVGVVLLLQVDQFRAQVADGGSFVGQLVNVHVADHGDVSCCVLYDVEVAVQVSGHARQSVWQHCADFAQVELVQADGDVLQCRWVRLLAVYLDASAVVGHEVYASLHLVVATQEDVVVLVEVELLISDGGPLGHEVEADAAIHHLCLCSQSDAELVAGVIVAQSEGGSALLQHAVEEGVEHELRILLVVAHLSAEGKVFLALCDSEVDGIEPHVVDFQRVYISASIESRLW